MMRFDQRKRVLTYKIAGLPLALSIMFLGPYIAFGGLGLVVAMFLIGGLQRCKGCDGPLLLGGKTTLSPDGTLRCAKCSGQRSMFIP